MINEAWAESRQLTRVFDSLCGHCIPVPRPSVLSMVGFFCGSSMAHTLKIGGGKLNHLRGEGV